MKKLALLLVPLLLAGCNSAQVNSQYYRITIRSFGYKYADGVYTMTAPEINLYSAAGAPDVREIKYVAILYNVSGEQATLGDSIVAPANGTLFGNGRGGYACRTTVAAQCRMRSPDAYFTDAGPEIWPENKITNQFLVPISWGVAHNTFSGPDGDYGAGWTAKFIFTATQSNGNQVRWEQSYQFVSPG